MDKQLLVSKGHSGIVVLTLNRPQSANAFSTAMLHELHETLYEIKYDRNVRCVIVTGAGEKVFCAGADLKERREMNDYEVRQAVSLIRTAMNEVEDLPQPVLAAINGAALGGGLELALACDIRIASTYARFGLTETSLGIIPGAGGTQRLPRLIGKGMAKELVFSARKIEADEAEKIGLVEYMVSHNELMKKTMELAERIVQNAPLALKQAKLAINKGVEVDLNTGLSIEQSAYEAVIPTKDRLEGLRAFKEKRRPIYKGE
ncbi:enoyl-CoA hydratase [Bacillus taeanensis]|uniref:Enoyl-CoA hydratase n=1 Tax=Bacillus taeanensis TaxID=273032 RepID=A0A366XS85_9BACI|nr:enoyl-CoA hydratase [Bacillus taeanensis]RBW67995.1 enoyl-CoA hydratase [Bacillus taeanensis]